MSVEVGRSEGAQVQASLSDRMIDQVLYWDDVQVGDRCTSGGRTVTEADVVNFAGLSGDFHALHTDETFAAASPAGRRIAHGVLVVSMSAGLVAKLPLMRGLERTTLGLKELSCRFLRPTMIGDTVSVDLEVADKRDGSKPDRGVVVMRRSIRNQQGIVVIEGSWVLVVRRR
jgi:acyl dehydratase